jgi:Glycosyl hydrolase family 26
MSDIKRHLSNPKVVATTAVVLALGAGAIYAASRNSGSSGQKQLTARQPAEAGNTRRQPREQGNTPRQRPAVAHPAKPSSVYWGAQIGTQLTGGTAPYDMKPVSTFQHLVGRGLSIVSWTAPFSVCTGSSCTPYLFPDTPMQAIRQYGAIPLLAWGSEGSGGPTQSKFQLADLINGRYDSYISTFASKARDWGHPFFLRFNWEMNGNWFPWGERANGNKPGEYVAAWHHVHYIFSSVGATNASWIWCPNVNANNSSTIQKNLRSLYPGNDYVDWTCLDGFNWGERRGSIGWRSFSRIYRKTYREVARIAPSKPMILGEIASSDYGGSKAAWIRNMLRVIPTRYPRIHGLVWLDANDRNSHWPIETSPSATGAFHHGIRGPAYVGNSLAALNASPIPVP